MKFIISLGGSIINPGKINIKFLKKFKSLLSKKHSYHIICGGGIIAREYQKAASILTDLTNEQKDWIGIKATIVNAFLLKTIFKTKKVVTNPNKKINARIVIYSGWKPGWSTDYDAVVIALKHKVKSVINLSNIDYVYDSDPNKNPKAKKLPSLSWAQYLKIVGEKFSPGMNAPFDPVASKLAKKHNISVYIVSPENIENFLSSKKFKGTIIR